MPNDAYPLPNDTFDFSMFLNPSQPTPSTSDIFAQLQLDTNPPTVPNHSHIARPESCCSHRLSFSGSDYSFTTTDVDTDDPMSNLNEAGEPVMQWTAYEEVRGVVEGLSEPDWSGLQNGTGYPTPGPSELATVGGGPLRGVDGRGEDEKKRKERLERE